MPKKLSSQIISATRVHWPKGTTELPEVSVENLKKYAISTEALGIVGAIAVNCMADQVQKIVDEAAPGGEVVVLHVPVWGAFVAALNALLGEVQRRKFRYVLFQSLEVVCTPGVLRKMLDHFTKDTLVVGPELDGHIFDEGEQPLNGRSTPWNTLSLWSVRKLGLTGFLNIADGAPEREARQDAKPGMEMCRQISGRMCRQSSGEESPAVGRTQTEASAWGGYARGSYDSLDDESPAMGTAAWWERHGSDGAVARHASLADAIPAGVEEVTAIALLQHLLGEGNARAVLLRLPPEMVSWKTDWKGDEARKQWHEYKMNTKITRPAAQIKQLFGKDAASGGLKAPLLGKSGGDPSSWRRWLPFCGPGEEESMEDAPANDAADPQLTFGTVWHFDPSIRTPLHVERICYMCVFLFLANFSSSFAAAFQAYNSAAPGQASTSTIVFVSLMIGGVYLPAPISLRVTRWFTRNFDHKGGLVFFAGLLIVTHLLVALFEALGNPGEWQRTFLVIMRLVEGLASGVLFQTRFILMSSSTQDQHYDLLSRAILAGDLGLAFGAVLPYLSALVAGESDLSVSQPELFPSVVFGLLSFALLVWILVAFPAKLYRLPSAVRFPAEAGSKKKKPLAEEAADEEEPFAIGARAALLVSGTLYVFVQSSALVALALWMRDAQLVGHFSQVKAVAALLCLPALVGMVASGVFLGSMLPILREKSKAIAFGTIGLVAVLFFVSTVAGSEEARVECVGLALSLLLVGMAFAGPFNMFKSYKHSRAEESLATLEWLKAYVGRLAAPMFTLIVHESLGSGPLLIMLCTATMVVALLA